MNDPQGIYAQKFKEVLEENTKHKLKIYPYGTLGESADIMEQTLDGILQFVDQSPGFTGALIPEAQVFFVPYIFPLDTEELNDFFRTSKAINRDFKKIYAKHGLELLSMFPEGEMLMTTKKRVRSPKDLKNVKFRVMTNPLLVETYKNFGASPTPLPWGEVYGGLQTGVIQGQENPAVWIYSTKLYEVTDHITFTGHNNFTTAVMANKEFYDGLSGKDKRAIQYASKVALEHMLYYQYGTTEESIKKIKKAKPSIKISRLTNKQKAKFKATAKRTEKKYLEMTGKSGAAILKQLKADLKAVKR